MRPPRALVLLLLIGTFDLVATSVLGAQGWIVERNPLMAPALDRGVGTFIVLKLATLAAAGLLLARQARRDRRAVRQACLWGSAAYAGLLAATLFGPL